VQGAPFNFAGQGESTFRVRITEELGFGGPDLTAKLTLSPPPGTNYDLFVYCLSCGGFQMSSTAAGSTPELIEVGRDDSPSDESFDVVVEVRWISGSTCDTWALTVLGNTPTADRTCN
jgi:hypothetical protein